MKKIKVCVCMVSLSMLCISIRPDLLHAQDFSGQEDYYRDYCSAPRATAEEAQTCVEFKAYMAQKNDNLNSEIDSIQTTIASIKSNISTAEEEIKKVDEVLTSLQVQIADNEAVIVNIQRNIITLQAEIIETQTKIEARNETIKARMVSEQATIGTNVYVEFLMGASDLLDMMRMIEGISMITANDKAEMQAYKEDKEKLILQEKEQVRLQEEAEEKKLDNEQRLKDQENVLAQRQEIVNAYLEQVEELNIQKREAQGRADAAEAAISKIDTSVLPVIPPNQGNDDSNTDEEGGIAGGVGGFVRPVPQAIGATTFYYPGTNIAHVGSDFVSPVGTPIRAPISGIIVYANNPVCTNCGSLGTMSGYPYGGGNTVHMIGQINGVTYAFSFFHMQQENWVASPGKAVAQGEVIGNTGSAGNVTGPHLHLEMFNLGSMTMKDAVDRFQRTTDFAWGTGWSSSATACDYNGGATPCRLQPHKYF